MYCIGFLGVGPLGARWPELPCKTQMGSESSSEAEEGGLEKAEAEEEEGFFQACFAPRKRTARRAPLRQLEPIAGGTAGDDNDDRGGRAPGNVDADADALAHKDAEVRSLKRELFKLKQKPSLRKLYMSNEGGSSGPESPDSPGPSEANLKPPAKATEAAEAVKQKDFEIGASLDFAEGTCLKAVDM